MTPMAHCVFDACLVAVVWMGGFVGLALSALSATEAFAVAMVPNLAVFALFFSQPMMNPSRDDFSKDESWSASFASMLPAHSAHLAMWDWESPDKKQADNRDSDTKALAETTLSWIVLCFLISLAAQAAYEKNWKG